MPFILTCIAEYLLRYNFFFQIVIATPGRLIDVLGKCFLYISHFCLCSIDILHFTLTERILARDWSRAMVYESIDHVDHVTCHEVRVVLFLVFSKKINVVVKNKSHKMFKPLQ